MRPFLHFFLVVVLAITSAMLQIGVVGNSWLQVATDLSGLLLIYWLVRNDVLAALLTAIVAGGLTDYMLGWALPGHVVVMLVSVGLYYLFSRRWLVAQTVTAVWLNVLIVWLVAGSLRWLLGGWAWVSYPDQQLFLEGTIVVIIGRALLGSLASAIWQRFRRASLTRVGAGR